MIFMKNIFFVIFFVLILAIPFVYGQDDFQNGESMPPDYPFILTPAADDVKDKCREEFILLNGDEWSSIMLGKFTGLVQYSTVAGLSEKKDIYDYKEAIKAGNEFLEKNRPFLGIKDKLPECTGVRGSENPEMGYVWLDYSGQIYNGFPVEGTKVLMKVDYPGKVIEIRCRWYPEIIIPEEITLSKEEIKNIFIAKEMFYKGYGGQELIYIITEKDIGEIEKVILPFRKEKEGIVEFYLTWKVSLNKDDKSSAWTVYVDAYSGRELYLMKNFK